jgi:hypothetical protein
MDVKIVMVNATASAAKQALSNIVIGLAAFFAASTTASGLARSLNISSVVGVSFGGCSGAVGGSGSPDRRLRGAAIRVDSASGECFRRVHRHFSDLFGPDGAPELSGRWSIYGSENYYPVQFM